MVLTQLVRTHRQCRPKAGGGRSASPPHENREASVVCLAALGMHRNVTQLSSAPASSAKSWRMSMQPGLRRLGAGPSRWHLPPSSRAMIASKFLGLLQPTVPVAHLSIPFPSLVSTEQRDREKDIGPPLTKAPLLASGLKNRTHVKLQACGSRAGLRASSQPKVHSSASPNLLCCDSPAAATISNALYT
ncbi:unnamed protein product [Alternaria burnsii]|nr:unnamed protein product [Alternaria burnsii]